MLHFFSCHLLTVPQFRLNTYGCRSFCVAGPVVWNFLPDFIRNPTSASSALEVLNVNVLYKSTHSRNMGLMYRMVCQFTAQLSPVPNHCLVTDAYRCEQLAQGCCPTAWQPVIELTTIVQRPNL